jgi:hypothetical protein
VNSSRAPDDDPALNDRIISAWVGCAVKQTLVSEMSAFDPKRTLRGASTSLI